MRTLCVAGKASGDDWGAFGPWQVAKDLGLIAMGMSRRGAFAFGLGGVAAAVGRPTQSARRAIIVSTPCLWAADAAASKVESQPGASTRRPGSIFKMTNQAAGTRAQAAGA